MGSRPIGVFDSGVGGLTVVKELFRQLPNEHIVYFGDTARVPYGTKSKETIERFSLENVLFLLKQNVKLIVVACNSVSSMALPRIEGHFKIPLVGVIRAGAKEALAKSSAKRIGVIGTKATIGSKAYEKEIKKLNSKVKIFSQSCPLFVPLAEEGILDGKITRDIVKMHLEPIKQNRIDTLILGCTHYPLLKAPIKKFMGDSVDLIDSAYAVVKEVKDKLSQMKMLNPGGKKKDIFFVTDETDSFVRTARMFLGKSLGKVNPVRKSGIFELSS